LKFGKFVINDIKQDEEVEDLCLCWEKSLILFLFSARKGMGIFKEVGPETVIMVS